MSKYLNSQHNFGMTNILLQNEKKEKQPNMYRKQLFEEIKN